MQNNLEDLDIPSENEAPRGWAPYLTSIGLASMGGFILGGIPGGAIGLSTSALDEYLIDHGYADKHYLSVSAFWSTMFFNPMGSFILSMKPSWGIAAYTLSYAAPLVASYYTNDFMDFTAKIELPMESFLMVNSLFDEKEIISSKELAKISSTALEDPLAALEIIKEDIKEIYNNEFLSTFIEVNALNMISLVINNLSLRYLASFHTNKFIIQLLTNHHSALDSVRQTYTPTSGLTPEIYGQLKGYLSEAAKVIGVFLGINLIDYFISTKQSSLNQDQFNLVIQKCNEILFTKGNGDKILVHEEGKVLIKEFTYDLYMLWQSGALKLNDVISSTSQILISVNNLAKISPAFYSAYAVSSIFLQVIMDNMSSHIKATSESLSEVGNNIWLVKSDFVDNIGQIGLRDGEEFSKYKYNSLYKEQGRLTKELAVINKQTSAISKISTLFDQVVEVIFYGYGIITGQLDGTEIPIILTATNDINSFIISNINYEIDNIDTIRSLKHVSTLLELVATPTSGAEKVKNEQGKIIFKDYVLSLDNKTLVAIDHLELIIGKHYAFTGKSGCGKTSTLIDLKGGVSGALSSTGEISISTTNTSVEPNVMFIDQKLYLPKEATLLEIAYYPNILNLLNKEQVLELRNKVTSLFKKLEIDGFINEPNNESGLIARLDSKEFKLSGGQTKKIAIIQAILSNPNILIIDETFTGLDKASLIQVQKAINEYLPNATILSVDHHAEDNNYNGFYDLEIHFEDSAVIELPIASKSYEEMAAVSETYNNLTHCSMYSLVSFNHYEVCPLEM